MNRVALVLLVLVGLGAAAWLSLADSGRDERRRADPAQARATPSPPHAEPALAPALEVEPEVLAPSADEGRRAAGDDRPRIAGRVRPAGGLPPGESVRVKAEVFVGRVNAAPPQHVAVEVAPDGAFELRVARDARYALLEVDSELLYQAEPVRALPGATDVVLAPVALAVVHGRVRLPPGVTEYGMESVQLSCRPELASGDAREPIASAAGFRWPHESRSASDGTYALTHLPSGVDLVIEATSDWKATWRGRVNALGPGERREVGIALELEPGCVAGTVEWADGRPAERFRVMVRDDARGFTFGHGDDAFEDGRFVQCGVDGPSDIEVTAWKGDVRGHASIEDVHPGTTGLRFVLEARPVYALRGTVVDSRQRPVRSFKVTTRTASGRVESRSFSSGSFALEALDPGELQVWIEADDHLPASQRVVVGPVTEPLRSVLAAAGRIRGTVVDPRGRPVAGARVGVQPAPVRSYARDYWTADPTGRFDVAAASSAVSILATGAGFAPSAPVELSVGAGELLDGVVLPLREPGRLLGRVLDPDGRPLAGVSISSQCGPAHDAAESGADGEFAFEGLPPDTASVRAMREDGTFVRASVAVVAGLTATVELRFVRPDPVRVEGRITRGGEPVACAVAITSSSGSAYTDSGPDGSFHTTLPHPGAWTISVWSRADRPRVIEGTLVTEIVVPDADVHVVELDLDALRPLTSFDELGY
jgi:hypothetical protein